MDFCETCCQAGTPVPSLRVCAVPRMSLPMYQQQDIPFSFTSLRKGTAAVQQVTLHNILLRNKMYTDGESQTAEALHTGQGKDGVAGLA